jgi:carbamoyl-phosphate synthase large subunit
MMRRVLFTGSGGAAIESIFEQWHARYDLYFADADPDAISLGIPAERRIGIPFAREHGFAEHALRLAEELRLDVIVPGVDEELPALAAAAPRSRAAMLLPDLPFVTTMLDKLHAAETMAAAGLDVPRTVPFARAHELRFPIVAKPRWGRGSRGVMQLADPGQLSAYLALAGNPDPSRFIAQEYVPGQEFTVVVAADRAGRLAGVVPIKVLLKRGITIRAETCAAPAIVDYAKRFQMYFKARGLYNIQCMLTADGRVLPFEINPRISTTFCLAIATGFDPIASFLNGHAGPVFVPRGHRSLHRTWRNTIAVIGDARAEA